METISRKVIEETVITVMSSMSVENCSPLAGFSSEDEAKEFIAEVLEPTRDTILGYRPGVDGRNDAMDFGEVRAIRERLMRALTLPWPVLEMDGLADTVDRTIRDVRSELTRAMGSHPPMNSMHEAYAVINEEMDEFWDIVKQKSSKRDLGAARNELIQIAAMAVRAIHDLGL